MSAREQLDTAYEHYRLQLAAKDAYNRAERDCLLEQNKHLKELLERVDENSASLVQENADLLCK
eukprot:1194918-Rhodomonas_salina.1